MIHLAITGETASWMLSKPGLIDQIHLLLTTATSRERLKGAEFVEGSLRLGGSEAGSIMALWNVDYSASSGDDKWGFVDVNGLCAHLEVSREVLERVLYVVSQRLHGLLIDGSLIHRAYSNGAHTCLAGRGEKARQLSVGYCEKEARVASLNLRAIVVTGPQYEFSKLAAAAAKQAESLDAMVNTARKLSEPGRSSEVLGPTEFQELRECLRGYFGDLSTTKEYAQVSVATSRQTSVRSVHITSGWAYEQWLAAESPLSATQRSLLSSDAIYRHPVRILGPGGSGKTLLMQLLAMRFLREQTDKMRRLLYLVHNTKMADIVRARFAVLDGGINGDDALNSQIDILTLSEYGQRELGLEDAQIISSDAHQAKQFQLNTVRESLRRVMAENGDEVEKSTLFRGARSNEIIEDVFSRLLMSEISTAIKGHGLSSDRKRYVESDRPLSRLHSVLSGPERDLVFSCFEDYHSTMFDSYGVLDSDDLALSLLGRLRAPMWDLKRKVMGYDRVFIDEVQLFNENERRLFPFLTKANRPFVPIVLALDEAQNIYGQSSSGIASLGIENVVSENLSSIHRSSRAIVRLAFFVIQRSTDLFGPDFPDFTKGFEEQKDEAQSGLSLPTVEQQPESQPSFGRFVRKRISVAETRTASALLSSAWPRHIGRRSSKS